MSHRLLWGPAGLLLVVSLWATAALAQAPGGPLGAPGVGPLTLEAALQRADSVSLDVQLQALTVEAASGGWRADSRTGDPSLRVRVRDLERQTVVSGQPEVVARLRLPLPRPWDLVTATEVGRASHAREEAQLDKLRHDLRLAVITRFHTLPLMQRAAEAGHSRAAAEERRLELVVRQRAEGLATELDWMEAEEELRDAQEDAARLDAAVREIEAEFRLLVAWPATRPLELREQDSRGRADAELPDASVLLSGAADRSAQVVEARARVVRAEAQLQRQQLRDLPWFDWVTAGAVFGFSDPTLGTQPPPATKFEVGVGVDIPVYRWGKGSTRDERYAVQAAEAEVTERIRQAEDRVVRQLREAEAARARWLVETAHTTRLTDRAAPLMGVAAPAVQLELEARLARAQRRQWESLARYIAQLDQLEAASGAR